MNPRSALLAALDRVHYLFVLLLPSLSPLSTQSANGYRPGAGAGELSSRSRSHSDPGKLRAEEEIKSSNGVYRPDRQNFQTLFVQIRH